ncbi:hypothetical protein Tco_0650550 [Tanacetum coccineum]
MRWTVCPPISAFITRGPSGSFISSQRWEQKYNLPNVIQSFTCTLLSCHPLAMMYHELVEALSWSENLLPEALFVLCPLSLLVFTKLATVSPLLIRVPWALVFELSAYAMKILRLILWISNAAWDFLLGLRSAAVSPRDGKGSEIRMHSGAPFIRPVSVLKRSINSSIVSPYLLLILWISRIFSILLWLLEVELKYGTMWALAPCSTCAAAWRILSGFRVYGAIIGLQIIRFAFSV